MSNYFIYIGNAYPHKNLKRLIEAMVFLNKSRKNPVFLKIGGSRSVFTEKLKNSINELNAGNIVKLLGYVPEDELVKLYKNSVAFVFPSLSEGFGLPGLEAIEAGTLVLASKIPVFEEVYQDNVIYFDPLDIRSIELAMEQALSMSKNEREEKIGDAKKFAKRYSWAKMAKETLEIYSKAL